MRIFTNHEDLAAAAASGPRAVSVTTSPLRTPSAMIATGLRALARRSPTAKVTSAANRTASRATRAAGLA